ncbi:MAG: potassium efflux system protein [Sulfurimonas sp.]|jgi:potassium efflux system protein|uniref:mechanosensitive ion channel family protein n=1 Tax=Sulfurimonas sp. TaxID=2022749 RepID=UPI0039E47896
MKILLLIALLYATLFSASIDVKLYDEKEREAYYVEITKEIELAGVKELRPKDIIKDELAQLVKIRDAISQKILIEKYSLKALNTKTISTKRIYDAINAVSKIQTKQEKNNKILTDIQSKILLLKQSIEGIVEEEKVKLLSYQLQFAYYKIQQKNIEQKMVLLEENEQKIQKILLTTIDKIRCNGGKSFDKELALIDKNIEEDEERIRAKELQKEKALIEGSDKVAVISKEIDLLNTSHEKAIAKGIVLNMRKSLCFLNEKDNTGFYKLISDLQDTINNLPHEAQKSLFQKQIVVLKDISKVELGRTTLFFGATVEESKAILLQIKEFIVSPLFVFNEQAISLLNVFMAILTIVFGFLFGAFYKKWISKITNRWTDVSLMSVRLISNIGYYIIILIFLIISVSSLGIDMSSLSLIAGALSIGIGFGLQTIVSNLFAGIILMFERTIRIGDIVDIDGVLRGTVIDMRIRSTTIKTFDNIDVVVPNSSFVQNNVINMTLEDRVRRLHIPFGVAYGTEIDDVKKALFDALKESELFYIKDNKERKPEIRMTLMNSSSVDLELIVWVDRDMKRKFISLESDFLILIYNALRANNIEIPFPQLDVCMKEIIEKTTTKKD